MAGFLESILTRVLELFGKDSVAPIVLFVLFILIAYYVFQVLQDIMIMIIISVAFPFMTNALVGTHFPTDIWSLVLFATIGMGLYFVYLFASWAIKASKILMFIVGIILAPFVALVAIIRRLIFGGKKKDKGKEKEKPQDKGK